MRTSALRAALALISLALLALPAFAEQYTLRFNPEVGKTQRYQMDVVQDMNMNLGPMGEQKMVSTNTIETSQTAAKDGANWSVKTSFDRVALDVQQAGQSMMSFDSTSGSNDPSMAAVNGMVGQEFVMTVNERGEIESIDGIDEMWQAAFKDVQDDPQAAAMMQQLEQGMGSDQMAQMMQAGMAVYPEGPVEVGDSWDWSTSNSNPMLGQMDVDMKYTLEGKSSTYAEPCLILDVEMEMEFGGGGAMLEQILAMSGGEGSFDIEDLEGEGKLCISERTGMVVHSEMNQVMKMKLSMSTGGQQMDMDFDIKQKTTQRLVN